MPMFPTGFANLPQPGSGGLTGAAGSGVQMPTFEFPQQQPMGQGEVSPQQLVWQRAMREAQDRQSRLSMQKWFDTMTPRPGREAINENFYKGVGLDTDIFNSASGPYGQLQQAAVLTAPSRADRAIAAMTTQANERMNAQDNATKAQIARAIAGVLAGGTGNSQIGETASDFQRFSPMFDPRLRRVQPRGVFAGA